ncbi:MAG: hypothetical protein L6R41_006176 [Letrouitia leprolyta]|nr:MAG: hypothetical protein L6R41_006176 [Letrouitia leprolyta]
MRSSKGSAVTGLIEIAALEEYLSEITADPADPKAPYAVPSMVVGTGFHIVSAFYSYMQYTRSGQCGMIHEYLRRGGSYAAPVLFGQLPSGAQRIAFDTSLSIFHCFALPPA